MPWVSRLWMTASELLWNKYETPTLRHSCAWWWNISERHSFWGRFLVKICNLSGAPRTVFSWWFSLRLLPFELSSSCFSIRESVRCSVNVFRMFPFPVTSGFTVYVLLRWAGTSWTITALDCKCHGTLTVNESHQLNTAMYERDVFFQICKPIRCTISSSPWLMHMLHSYSVSPASELQCAVCFVFEVQQCWSQLPNTIKLCVVVAFLRGDLWNSHGHLLNVFEGHNIWWIMALIWQSCFLFSSSCSLRHFHIHFEWKSTYGFESCEMVHIYGGEMQRPLEHMVMTFIHIHVSADWLLNGLM